MWVKQLDLLPVPRLAEVEVGDRRLQCVGPRPWRARARVSKRRPSAISRWSQSERSWSSSSTSSPSRKRAACLPESRGAAEPLDLRGACHVTTGAVALVWALTRADGLGWASTEVVVSFVAGALALVGFVWWERRAVGPANAKYLAPPANSRRPPVAYRSSWPLRKASTGRRRASPWLAARPTGRRTSWA